MNNIQKEREKERDDQSKREKELMKKIQELNHDISNLKD